MGGSRSANTRPELRVCDALADDGIGGEIEKLVEKLLGAI